MKHTPPYIICDDSITIVVAGKPYTINSSNVSFGEVKARIQNEDFDNIEALFDTGAAVGSFTKGNIVVQDNAVLYRGQVVNNHVVDRILSFMREGLPYKPLVAFLDNLMANPSYRAVQELYGFLEASNLPITEDGCFLAYRKVTEDYKDFYTKMFDNSIGQVVKMARNLVDEDQNRTCSQGLHFCSQSYLSQYSGGQGRVVIVKINPANVVAIPTDYANAKGRCCEYLVFSDCAGYEAGQSFGPLYLTAEDEAFDDTSIEDVEEDEIRGRSYTLGYELGEEDATNENVRNSFDAWGSAGGEDYRENDFYKGYHHGYDNFLEVEGIPASPLTPKARVGRKQTWATRLKLSRIAKNAKRGPNGSFVK